MKPDFKEKAIRLLCNLIATPSFSKEEDQTAQLLADFFKTENVKTQRYQNNVWVANRDFSPGKPTVLLNSHHDTVRPNPGYTREPFRATIEEGKLYGLGSNDAGGPLVSLIAAFLHYYDRENLPFNLILAATAEEEISGANGIEALLHHLPPCDFAMVGEPTQMEVAIAEKGLLVIDCKSVGKAGHAAREEGINAIYEALDDIHWFKNHRFEKISEVLGAVKMSVTVVKAGQAHNQVPAECDFTVDVRVTDSYTLEEILDEIRRNVKCEIKPRSLRIRPSSISKNHLLTQAAVAAGCKPFGSPTTSDQALLPFPSVKIGPGDSARSHSANEFIYTKEIEDGIDRYVTILTNLEKLIIAG